MWDAGADMMDKLKEEAILYEHFLINNTNAHFSPSGSTAATTVVSSSGAFLSHWQLINATTDFNNFSYNFKDPGYVLRYGITVTALLSIAYFIVFIVGVLGNIAVVLVVFKTTRMRSPTNQFIANLAIADLLVNILCLPFTLIGNLFPAWILGEFFCKFVSYSQGVSVSASVNTLMAISIERCAAITFPLSGIMTPRQYRIVVSFIWAIALTINLPWLFVFTLEPLEIHGSQASVCIEMWPSERSGNIYFLVANLTICYLGPLTVISFCYMLIWRKVATRSVPGEQSLCHKRNDAVNKIKIKVIKMVFVVIITFAISWFPLYTIFCIVKFTDLMSNQNVQKFLVLLLPIAQWLGASNSCINPVLYAFMNHKFRIGFKNLIQRTQRTATTIAWDQDFNNVNLKIYKSDPFYKRKRNLIVKTESTRLSSSSPNMDLYRTEAQLSTSENEEILYKIRL